MATSSKLLGSTTATFLGALLLAQAQTSSPSPAAGAKPAAALQSANSTAKPNENSPVLMAQTSAPAASPPATAGQATSSGPATSTVEPENLTENGGVGVREFQGDDVGQVLRLLARQAKINMVVSEQVTGTVTMRLEDVTALQAIAIIVKAKNLFMDKIDNVYYIKTGAERTAEPTESDSHQFSYSRAKDVVPLIASQLASKDPPQVDERTNTIFFRETRGNIDNIRKLFVQIDKPTKQVMIEARLVEVTANPKQSYGINWAGTFGGSATPKTFQFACSSPASFTVNNGVPQLEKLPTVQTDQTTGQLKGFDFLRDASHRSEERRCRE